MPVNPPSSYDAPDTYDVVAVFRVTPAPDDIYATEPYEIDVVLVAGESEYFSQGRVDSLANSVVEFDRVVAKGTYTGTGTITPTPAED